jgi:hypothetical protein
MSLDFQGAHVARRALFLAAALVLAAPGPAHAYTWRASAALGDDMWFAPEFGQHGYALFDLYGASASGRGDLHVNFNTETLYVGLERLRPGTDRVELGVAVRLEGAYAGVLPDWYQGARSQRGRGFFASYAQAFASAKWLPGGDHSVELVLGGRAWLFARADGVTRDDLTLPVDTWVFEPRLRYTFWHLRSDSDAWRPHVLLPRFTGFAAGVELGADVRDDTSAWGAVGGRDDGRNRPATVILMARQWLRAGLPLGARVRLQVEEFASWGAGEDDLTRVRAGGMNPYVVPVPGLPWPALLCERLVAAQASVHVRPSLRAEHELGVAVSAGAFNDVRRVGALMSFDAAGGAALFTDLRLGRWNVHARGGWAFPTSWLERPNVSALVALGVRLL